ncbi:MAG: hypothetical protein OQJ97_18555, partial [Rhodospirillales bacterium]|nr:hypothetical protein [Rhodospirillales bacterium]
MSTHPDEYQQFVDQKRFLSEIEHGIRLANREIIDKRIPSITKDSILSFAVAVARLRANYLSAAFEIGSNDRGEAPNDATLAQLKKAREQFEETK